MLKNILSLIVCGVFFVMSGIILVRAENGAQTIVSSAADVKNVGNKICPVMGNQIN